MSEEQPRRRWVVVLLAVAYSGLIFFAVGEIGTRAFGLLDRLTGTPRDLYQPTGVADLAYRLTPGTEVDLGDASITVNRFGLRGPEIEAEPVAGVARVLVLGDSIIYGQGLDDDETFSVQLEGELRRRGRSVEVLNGGVPGYNNAAELAFLREYGLALKPDRVILGISLNDFGETPVLSQSGVLTNDRSRARDPERLLPVSEFWLLLRWMATYRTAGHWFQGDRAETGRKMEEVAETLVSRRHRRFYEKPNAARWQQIRASLAAIRDLLRQRGLPLTLVVFPEKYQQSADDTEPQRRWLDLCRELDLDCIDLWPAFHETGGDLYLGAQHHTAAGHALAAREVADAVWPSAD